MKFLQVDEVVPTRQCQSAELRQANGTVIVLDESEFGRVSDAESIAERAVVVTVRVAVHR